VRLPCDWDLGVMFPCGGRGWKRDVGWPKVAANRGEGDVGAAGTRGEVPLAGVGISDNVSPKFKDSWSRVCFDNVPFARSPPENETDFVRGWGDLTILRGALGDDAVGKDW
jgi:hypothetical protein